MNRPDIYARFFYYIWAMRTKYRYKSLADTLEQMGKQVFMSLNFAQDFIPRIKNPAELFWILKNNVVYKNDPVGIELLQTLPSLMEDNFWGIPGAGDCDCFTIAALACCKVRDIPVRVVLVGNDRMAPTHIYTEVLDEKRWVPFDLVAPQYGITKPYKYKEIVNVL